MRMYIVASLILLLCAVPRLKAEDSRSWTSSDGKVIKGSIVSLKENQITLKTERGNFKFPLSRLSQEDQKYALNWQAKSKMSDDPAPDDKKTQTGRDSIGNFENLKLGEWPKSVSAEFELDQIQVIKEDRSGEYIYRSPHFEFQSNVRLSTSVVREFSRIFEATYELINAIPVGLNAQPSGEGFYMTKLYERKEQYFSDGGMVGSGGMFTQRGGKGMIKIPLPNLGVKNTGTRFIVDAGKRSDTLIHEITHQVMMRWGPLLPVWISEGFAEVTSSQIYSKGRFRLNDTDRAVKDEVTRYSSSKRDFTMVKLDEFMSISDQKWDADLADGNARRNYSSANILLYYFLRMDGEGKGEKLVSYLKARIEGMNEEEARTEILLAGRTYEQLQTDVVESWRSEGLKITFE